VTLRQLLTFATVARLGSVQASARELGISEPAVSAAVGTLRKEFGDRLYRREGGALVLTPAGRHLASLAAEITDLADRARHADDEGGRRLHVAVTVDVEEHVVAPLLAAFTDREPNLNATVGVESPERFADLLVHRRADITLGPRPAVHGHRPLVAVAFLRFQLAVVASAAHPLAGEATIEPAVLERQPWCVGPGGVGRDTAIGRLHASARITPADVRAFPSDAAALSAVAAGDGIMLTLAHAALPELRRGAIVRIGVAGTPIHDQWYATTLDATRRCRRHRPGRPGSPARAADAGPASATPSARPRPGPAREDPGRRRPHTATAPARPGPARSHPHAPPCPAPRSAPH